MGLKPSRYNFFFDGEGGAILAFNSMTAALAKIEPEKWSIIQAFLENPNRLPENKTEKELLEQLKYGGFLIDEDFDELAHLKVTNRMTRFSRDLLSITIAPTMKCNFACFYCYEVKSMGSMPEEIQKSLLDFVKERLPGTRKLEVNWYGGEPLLALNIIESLSKVFIELCDNKGVNYFSHLVTNGYLLTPENAQRLSDLKVLSAQVTLDGPPDIHDKRRVLSNGGPTFWKILENIKLASDLMKIHLRVTVDKTNIGETGRLLDILEKEGIREKISIYYSRTTPYSDVCADAENICIPKDEFDTENLRSLKELLTRGFRAWQKPRRRANACNADALNAFLILPNGDIHKCWIGTGTMEESLVGSVFDGEFNHNLVKWLSLDVFEEKQYVDCKILPLCMGGCPAVSLRKLPGLTRRLCEFHNEETLLEHMKLFVEYGVPLKDKTKP